MDRIAPKYKNASHYGGAPFIEINVGFLANEIGIATSDALNLSQGVHDLLFAIDVCVEQTQNELEVGLFPGDERCMERMLASTSFIFDPKSHQRHIWTACANIHMMGNLSTSAHSSVKCLMVVPVNSQCRFWSGRDSEMLSQRST